MITVWNVFNHRNQLIATLDPALSAAVSKRFVYGTNPSVPDYMFVPSTGHTFKFVTDHLGSPVEIIDVNTGAVAEEIHYDDFGNVTSDSNPGFQPFGFAGCLYDIETKLCQFGARQYDASTGRWLTKDPILFAGGDTNLYGYVLQDPINYIDPSGLDAAAVANCVLNSFGAANIGLGLAEGLLVAGCVSTFAGDPAGVSACIAAAGLPEIAALGASVAVCAKTGGGGGGGSSSGSGTGVPGVPGTGSSSTSSGSGGSGGVPGVPGTGTGGSCG